ncbi:pyridoxamine 5'-phosphate oxidase family protein [Polaribacter sp. IC073]|uniref:pyridoxamine 5'-phosphate oxidase family protein n=1 Tax=Polaribacter sp. IC073 TaxID=2508540 RepID=UPI0011BF9A9F|nr:pyridoxamine 5'-phosphate oxidase family protein [Polaribacter sp. IC073]TXD48660.1 flavin mononucleotide-binding protein [Polaribacter sp. IC073]
MIKALSTAEKKNILNTNYIGDLGYIFKNEPIITPITYYYNEQQNSITCHLSNSQEINALRKKKKVSLCVSNINSISDWKSVLVQGTYHEHSGSGAKSMLHQFSLGVKNILKNSEQRYLDFINQFSNKIDENDIPVIFTIEIEDITGKRK